MYLSRLTLNPQHASARRDIACAYDMHRTLARVYAPSAERPPQRFLWRLERSRDFMAGGVVLVQSESRGLWDRLGTVGTYASQIEPDKQVRLDGLIRNSCQYRFRLLVNATVTRAGKRFGLQGAEALLGWLNQQGERNGFRVVAAVCEPQSRLELRPGRSQRPIQLDRALLEGILEATDTVGLSRAIASGLGHGKAFGLGMLSLAPIKHHAAVMPAASLP